MYTTLPFQIHQTVGMQTHTTYNSVIQITLNSRNITIIKSHLLCNVLLHMLALAPAENTSEPDAYQHHMATSPHSQQLG